MDRRLTYQELYAFKEDYAFHKVVYLAFEGEEFVFRSLGREEYNQIIGIVKDSKDLEDVLAQTALLYPEGYEMASSPLAGLPEYVANLVIELSDVSNMDSLLGMLKSSQALAERFDWQCLSVIKAAMPEISFEEMQRWTWEKIMFYTAISQKILNLTLPPEGQIDLIDQRPQEENPTEKKLDPRENPEVIEALRRQGIDPMFHFYENGTFKTNLIDTPFLGGRYWDNEGVLNEIRRTISARRHRRNGSRR